MIPVFSPKLIDEDVASITRAVLDGEISGLQGRYLDEFEQAFSSFSSCQFGVAVTSGTTALQLAVRALNLPPQSEILVSSCTNVATALAVYHNNCITVPIDSERHSWNIDLTRIEEHITPRTRAIIPVHFLGCPIDMTRLMEIARAHNLHVIEDCAEAHGAQWRSQPTGSFGDAGCYSFYANKIITTGEGGMITTGHRDLATRCRYLKNLAHGTPRFVHEEAGFNFRMTAIQAALGIAQLRRIQELLAERRLIAEYYTHHLADLEELQLQVTPTGGKHAHWAFGAVVKLPGTRDRLMKHLLDHGVDSRTFFAPMNQQPFLLKEKAMRSTTCPVAEDLWHNGIQLPSGYNLSEKDLESVTSLIRGFFA